MNSKVNQADQLYRQICRLRLIAYFIESQDPYYTWPTDFEDIQYGFTQILNEILEELILLKKSLEN